MMPRDSSRWREIRVAFDEIVELSATGRARRLAAMGDRDADLRHAVESLLAADTHADGLLARFDFGVTDLLADEPARSGDVLKLVDRTVSHFRIIEPLASGGMGVVYRAQDLHLNRSVALKFPLPLQQVEATVKQRFLREARAAATIEHPNLCTVYEVAETEDGQPFLAMPLYPGETLKARLAKSTSFPVGEALRIAGQIAQGLAAAHAGGVIHRDLKPGNLMLLPDGSVKILDFGLAKLQDASHATSTTGLGTVAYMAPEQIRGDPAEARADLWSLGVLLYEMVTGRRPFDGERDISVAQNILDREPCPASLLCHDVPRALEELITDLLQKSPGARHASAEEVLADIDAIRHGMTLPFRRSSPARLGRWLRHRRRGTIAALLLTVSLVAIAGFGSRFLVSVFDRKPTSNNAAYEFYLRGLDYDARFSNTSERPLELLSAAETLYRRALQLDPDFALARAKLANVLFARYLSDNRRPALLNAVRAEAEAALRVQPELSEAHLALSFYWEMRRDYDRALAALERARRADPMSGQAWAATGDLYLTLERWDDALAAFQRAHQLDRRAKYVPLDLARTYERLRRYADAARYWDIHITMVPDAYAAMLNKGYMFIRWRGTGDSLAVALKRIPEDWDPRGLKTRARVVLAAVERRPADALAALAAARQNVSYDRLSYTPHSLLRGRIYEAIGDTARAAVQYDTARIILERLVAEFPDDARMRIALAAAWAGLGRRDEALAETRRTLAAVPLSVHAQIATSLMHQAAGIYVQLHEHPAALDLLKQLLRIPAGGQVSAMSLRVEPMWDGLRGNTRFARLIDDHAGAAR